MRPLATRGGPLFDTAGTLKIQQVHPPKKRQLAKKKKRNVEVELIRKKGGEQGKIDARQEIVTRVKGGRIPKEKKRDRRECVSRGAFPEGSVAVGRI